MIVRVGSDVVTATIQGRRQQPLWAGETARGEGEGVDAAVERLLSQVPKELDSPVTLEVEPPLAQIRRLDSLPPVRGAALSTLVGHQAGTFFRKNGHPLVTDAAWLPALKDSPRQALLAAIDLELAEALSAAATRAGVGLDRITVADIPEARRFDLRSPEARAEQAGRASQSLARLAWSVATLWALAALCWTARLGLEARHIRSELNRLAGARAVLIKGQAVRHRAEQMIETLESGAAARHQLQDRTQALLAALPDSAYLSGLSLDTLGNGLLTGGARHATDAVAALEHAHAAVNPRQEGSTSPDPLGSANWERFTIRLGSVPR